MKKKTMENSLNIVSGWFFKRWGIFLWRTSIELEKERETEKEGGGGLKVAQAGWRRGVTVARVIKWRPYVQKWCSP